MEGHELVGKGETLRFPEEGKYCGRKLVSLEGPYRLSGNYIVFLVKHEHLSFC